MNHLSPCLLIFFLLQAIPHSLSGQPAGSNTLFGQVHMPLSVKSQLIRRGDAYRQRGSEVATEAKRQIDEANQPDRNVVVALFPLDFTLELAPTPNAVLMQREKTFIPNVLPVTRGSTILIENGDDFFHNVFSITPGARFNIGRRPPGNQRMQLVDRAGEVRLFCDIHPQMNAVILSLETLYFTKVDQNGTYRLERLPDGRYRYEVYHPEAGVLRGELRLRGGAPVVQDFDFRAPNP